MSSAFYEIIIMMEAATARYCLSAAHESIKNPPTIIIRALKPDASERSTGSRQHNRLPMNSPDERYRHSSLDKHRKTIFGC